jgi:hypothetical protein
MELQVRGIDHIYVADASAPRLYPEYREDYYAIFFSDPDGIRLELVGDTEARPDHARTLARVHNSSTHCDAGASNARKQALTWCPARPRHPRETCGTASLFPRVAKCSTNWRGAYSGGPTRSIVR